MKKLLRTLFVIILLVGVFFLIRKNTTRFGSVSNEILFTGGIETDIDVATGDVVTTGSTAPIQTGETNTAITTDQGYITETYSTGDKNYLKIDYVEFGAMGDGGAPEIINNNPLIRTFEVASDAVFTVFKYNTDGGQEPQNIQRNEFKIRGNGLVNPDPHHPTYYGKGGANGSIVTIEHDSQIIYKITEDYRP